MLKQKLKKLLAKNKIAFYVAQRIVLLYKKSIENLRYLKIYLFHNKDKNLISDMQDGILRIRITNKCNAKCSFCGQQFWDKDFLNMTMDPKILYEYCKPLYENIKIILLTGGEPIVAKESFNYCKFISDNYSQITIMLESNCLGFDDKWQNFAMNNLMRTHFSINASSERMYSTGCWSGEEGKSAFRKIKKNLESYVKLLKDNKLEVFAPSISMVVNKNNTPFDVRSFIEMGLKMQVQLVVFYFDIREGNTRQNHFIYDDFIPILKELTKIERVLAKKFYIFFRLYVSIKDPFLIQKEVDKIPLEELRKEYADLLKLAENRSMDTEYKKRQEIRRIKNKKEFTFYEDWTPTVRHDKYMKCMAPFELIDIYPDGKIECCSWIYPPRIKLTDYIHNNNINWNKLFNSIDMKLIRYNMLKGKYDLCMKCCPLNPTYHECIEPHKYGYNRIEE